MSLTITVEKVTRESKKANGVTYWGVLFKGDWYNVFGDPKPAIGQSLVVDVDENIFRGNTYRWAHVIARDQKSEVRSQQEQDSPSTAAAPSTSSSAPQVPPPVPHAPQIIQGRQTPYTQSFAVYEAVARKAHALALELEPDLTAYVPRMTIVNTCLIALGEGKLSPVIENDLRDGSPNYLPNLPTLPEDIFGAFDSQASQASQKTEMVVEDKTDWQLKLSTDIKAYCNKKGIVFENEKKDILFAVAGTRDFRMIDQALAKRACGVLKEKYT